MLLGRSFPQPTGLRLTFSPSLPRPCRADVQLEPEGLDHAEDGAEVRHAVACNQSFDADEHPSACAHVDA